MVDRAAGRRWFGHDPAKWEGFRRRYFAELDAHPDVWQPLRKAAQQGDLTLLFGAHEAEHNNAIALTTYLDRQLSAAARPTHELAA